VKSVWVVAACGLTLAAMVRVDAQSARPLPDAGTFFEETQRNIERARREEVWYAYTERRTELRRNPFGHLGTGRTRAFRVTPEPDGAVIVRQLIEEDGVPVRDGKVERIDLERRRQQSGRRRRRSSAEDTMSALRFSILRREQVAGRDAIVVAFEPREDARPETREGKLALAFTGSVWVDEAAREVVRVEATALDSISFGMGLLARLSKGSTASLERARIDDDTWMLTSLRFSGEGRAVLFLRKLTIDHVVEWSDYQKIPAGATN
jgi:hypothetical protein